jgi:hypothetical protein
MKPHQDNIMALTPGQIEILSQVAIDAACAPHGSKDAVYARACDRLNGISLATLHRYLNQVAVRSPRKQRSDSGVFALGRAEAEVISAYIMRHYRGNGKKGINLDVALRDLRENKLVRAEVIDATTGAITLLSASAVLKALKGYGLHWQQVLIADRPMAVAQSTPHPNHTWQIDASVCTLFYLDDDGTSPMPANVFYKNKPENFERVAKQRVTRFVITDHNSGAIKVRYFLGSESVANYAEFFLWALQKQPGYTDPFHGVPLQLMADPGSGLAGAFKNLVRRLGINLIINKAGNPAAKGQVENAQNLVEMGFEHQFRAHRPANLAVLNERAQVWACNFNSTAVLGRHGKTRFMKWMEITAEHLRTAPSLDLCRELLTGAEKDCLVDQYGRVQFGGGGRKGDVRSVPGVAVGQKLPITFSAYNEREVFCVFKDADGREVLHPCPLVEMDEHGFALDARVIGSGYQALPDTAADINRKQALMLTTGTTTLKDAEKAQKQKDFEVFNGAVRFDYLRLENAAQVPFVPKAGVALEVGTVTTSTPVPVRMLTQFEAAQALVKHGMVLNAELVATLKNQYPDGVPEDQIEALHARLTVRSGLRVVNGGAL